LQSDGVVIMKRCGSHKRCWKAECFMSWHRPPHHTPSPSENKEKLEASRKEASKLKPMNTLHVTVRCCVANSSFATETR